MQIGSLDKNRGSFWRIVFVVAIFLIIFTILILRVLQIQVIERDYYAKKSHRMQKSKLIWMHKRGVITDKNDEVVAFDSPSVKISSNPYHIHDFTLASRYVGCYYLRQIVGKKVSEPDGKMALPILEPAANSILREYATWNSIPKNKRWNMVSHASRILRKHFETKPEKLIELKIKKLSKELHRPLGLSQFELTEKLNTQKKSPTQLLSDRLDMGKMESLKKMFAENYVQGFQFEESMRREHPESKLAVHIIGMTNGERKGTSGIERSQNNALTGTNGHEIHNTDARGRIIPGKVEVKKALNGNDIRLTIDLRIQDIVEQELENAIDYYKCKQGGIVVMDPKTGEIIAMASYPEFDLQSNEDYVRYSFNYPIQALNEPGSTMKIVATAAAINEGKANYYTSVDTGTNRILYEREANGKRFTVEDHSNFPDLALWQVIERSSNTGTWQFAKKIGRKRFYEYSKAFGFGEKSGIELAGERAGRRGDKQRLRNGRVINSPKIAFTRCSYGYGMQATPLQIAAAYSVIANNGIYTKPHLIKEIISSDGKKTLYSHKKANGEPNVPQRRVLKKRTAKVMRDALATVLTGRGTGKKAKVKGYKIGGKTGTTRKVIYNKKLKKSAYVKGRVICSFAGICPIDEPDFVAVIVLDDPRLTEVWSENVKQMIQFYAGGGSVAAPVFAKLVERIAPLRGIKQNLKQEKE